MSKEQVPEEIRKKIDNEAKALATDRVFDRNKFRTEVYEVAKLAAEYGYSLAQPNPQTAGEVPAISPGGGVDAGLNEFRFRLRHFFVSENAILAVWNYLKINDLSQKIKRLGDNERMEPADIDFLMWYSGMDKEKILRAYEKWLKELNKETLPLATLRQLAGTVYVPTLIEPGQSFESSVGGVFNFGKSNEFITRIMVKTGFAFTYDRDTAEWTRSENCKHWLKPITLPEGEEAVRLNDAISLIEAMASRFRNNGKGFWKGEYLIGKTEKMVSEYQTFLSQPGKTDNNLK